MIIDSLRARAEAFEEETGWTLRPEGACRGEVCVPLAEGTVADGVVALDLAAEALGMAVVHDEQRGLWSIGPATPSGHALATAEAPELVLPTIDGEEFRLSSLRGQKVVLVAWAPY